MDYVHPFSPPVFSSLLTFSDDSARPATPDSPGELPSAVEMPLRRSTRSSKPPLSMAAGLLLSKNQRHALIPWLITCLTNTFHLHIDWLWCQFSCF